MVQPVTDCLRRRGNGDLLEPQEKAIVSPAGGWSAVRTGGRIVGMELIGRRLTSAELRAVLDDPAAVSELLYGDLDDDAEMPEPDLDLDKNWHVIHYLLTGSAWGIGDGAGAAVLGGVEIGEDGGYGPARLLDPGSARAIAADLDALNVDALRPRFDRDALAAAEIYPAGWEGGDSEWNGLVEHFAELRRFYQTAATNGQAVLLAIC